MNDIGPKASPKVFIMLTDNMPLQKTEVIPRRESS